MKNVNKNGALSKFELEINSTKTLIKPKIKSKRFKFELKNTKKAITSSNKNEESIGGRYITANKREFKVQNLKAKDNLKKSTKVKIQSNIKSTKRKRYNLELCDRQENFKKQKQKRNLNETTEESESDTETTEESDENDHTNFV